MINLCIENIVLEIWSHEFWFVVVYFSYVCRMFKFILDEIVVVGRDYLCIRFRLVFVYQSFYYYMQKELIS